MWSMFVTPLGTARFVTRSGNRPGFGRKLMKLGMSQRQAHRYGNAQKGYRAVAGSGILTHTITNKRLAAAGFQNILLLRVPAQMGVEPPGTEPNARWCGRSATQIRGDLLPDYRSCSSACGVSASISSRGSETSIRRTSSGWALMTALPPLPSGRWSSSSKQWRGNSTGLPGVP